MKTYAATICTMQSLIQCHYAWRATFSQRLFQRSPGWQKLSLELHQQYVYALLQCACWLCCSICLQSHQSIFALASLKVFGRSLVECPICEHEIAYCRDSPRQCCCTQSKELQTSRRKRLQALKKHPFWSRLARQNNAVDNCSRPKCPPRAGNIWQILFWDQQITFYPSNQHEPLDNSKSYASKRLSFTPLEARVSVSLCTLCVPKSQGPMAK